MIMEYQKIINLLDHRTNQQSKFRTRNWVEINYESREDYNNNDNNNNIKFKATMIRPYLSDYSDAYIPNKGTIKVPTTAAEGAAVNNTNEKEAFKILLHLLVALPK